MDVHYVPGAEAIDVAEAHRKDLLVQNEHRCKAMTYWIDEIRGVAFCLIEAPDKSKVEDMHRQAHGLMPNKILEVSNELVTSFLGRIHDPEDVTVMDNGLRVFSDSAFRIILVTELIDPVLLQHAIGADKANALLERLNSIARKAIAANGGREVEHTGPGFIVSFSSATSAVACALDIQQHVPETDKNLAGLRLAVSSGEPISKSNVLFGDAVQLASCLCRSAAGNKIAISAEVKTLLAHDYYQQHKKKFSVLPAQDQGLAVSLLHTLEENWQDPEFTITEFCQSSAMSKSQLYRKTIALFGQSPITLLKEFRLEKARELLKKQLSNITGTTFDSGFSSPSYFTKCFKKKFGLLPAVYSSSANRQI
jgi:AraC-like DNA-binding protein